MLINLDTASMTVRSLLLHSAIMVSMAACSTHRQEKAQMPAQPESLPMEVLSLDNLDAFAAADNNWQLGGDVYVNRQQPHQLELKQGKGILAFTSANGNGALRTKMEHGDMDLELDFMLSGEASATLLFQGKYPLHIKDSWLKDSLSAQDCGGVEDHAPLLNACKAPGLWQHLVVKFKTARSRNTSAGTTEAGFEMVQLNGRTIQQETALALIASDSLLKQVQAGPLTIMVQQGPIAFRNIRYKTYNDKRASLANVQYHVYKGVYKNHDTLKLMMPLRSGQSDSLTYRVGDKRSHLLLEGKLLLPVQGEYVFSIRAGGPVRLMIDGNEIANNGGTREYQHAFYGDTILAAGPHNFQLSYANYDESLVLLYEGPHIPFTALTTPASERPVEASPDMEYVLHGTPAIQRSFIKHHGAVDPYSISVGTPEGINYAYDLVNYSPLLAWHGRYIDVAEMWHERGEQQLARPLGATLELAGIPCIAELSSVKAPWPDSIREDSSSYTNRGYKLLPNGLPVFFYTLHQWQVEDYLHPREDGKGLQRDVTLTANQAKDNAYWLLASGGIIEKLRDGSYAVDDKSYYIETDAKPEIVKADSIYRLVLPLQSGNTKTDIHYSIIW